MKREIKKYELNYQTTISYFTDHIQSEKKLSGEVLKNITLEQGKFFTLLPLNAEIDRMYEFRYGGIIPPIPYGNQKYTIQGSSQKFHPTQVITMSKECSEFIAAYLQEDDDRCAIIENYMLEPNSPHIQIKNVEMVSYGKEVYYFLKKENTSDEILETIRKFTEIWHSLFILTKTSVPLSLTNDIFDIICKQTHFIITAAYDGEGYVFWEKM